MTLERMQLSVAPGDGLVARFGPVVVVVTGTEGDDDPGVAQLLEICRDLASSTPGPPGRWLVDRIGLLLGRPESPSFCVMASGDDSLHVVIQGEIDLWAARGDHLSRHTGAEPGTWVDVVIEGEFDSLTVGPAGTRPVGDPRVDLQGGVVIGNGVLLFARPADGGGTGEHGGGDPARAPVRAAAAATGAGVGAGATGTTTAPPPAQAAAAGTASAGGAAATAELPLVGSTCPQGHANLVGAAYCSVCGVRMVSNGQVAAPRSLGTLVLDDGTTHPLDSGYVIGREPGESGSVQSGISRPIALDDPDRVVSRIHAEVRIADGIVQLVDRDSVNGTYVLSDNGGGWKRLAPNEPYELRPGGEVLIGRRTLRFLAG